MFSLAACSLSKILLLISQLLIFYKRRSLAKNHEKYVASSLAAISKDKQLEQKNENLHVQL